MIIKATSHTINTIWKSLLLILLVFVALIGALKYGIQIDNLTLPKIKVSQLYIKLDKKLIVEIETLVIEKETQADTSLEKIAQVIKNFPYLNLFFSQVTIRKMSYENEDIHLVFKDNIFYLESKHLNVNLKITPLGRFSLDLEIEEAFLKDFSLHLKGKTHINLQDKIYTFKGDFETFGINGIALLDITNNLLNYHLQADTFTNVELTNLMDFLAPQTELEPLAKAWIHQNIIAKSYKLHYLEGKLNLQNFDYFPLQMKGLATAKDVIVAFEPTVPPAHADEIGIELKEDKLLFDVKNPTYEQKAIQRANVFIYNLLTKGTGIVVDLDAISKLDGAIHKILHAFDIRIPITQTSGETDAYIRLDIKFLPYDINATGKFKVKKSDFTLNGLEMFSQSSEIRLDNNLVYLDKTNLRYKTLFDITTTGLFDTKNEIYTGLSDINALMLDFSGARLLDIKDLKDQNSTMRIDTNATHINIPNLGTHIEFQKYNNLFSFDELSKIAPFSPFMQENGVKNGALVVSTKNFEKFIASIDVQDASTPLLDNNTPLTSFKASLSTDTKTLDVHTLDEKVSVHFDKKLAINVTDLNISLPKDDEPFYSPIHISIKGKNSSFIDLQSLRTILSDSYTLDLLGDNITLHSKKGISTFDYIKEKKRLKINSDKLNDDFINNLFSKSYFKQGDFILQLEGENDKNFHGIFIMHETSIKDLKFFDNLMATINAIPSLIVFSDPKFNQGGYFVKNSYVNFSKNDEIMTITDMRLIGNNADISGTGTIDFKTNQLDLKLKLKTLKTFSNAIDFVPIVGGIILGEDRRFSTNINVKGEIDDPKIQTNLILDTIKSPFNIIQRTLELPLEIFK